MNIHTLEAYVAQKNTWTRIFKGRELSLLNKADRQRIADMIDADMSPENLTCDGELPPAMVRDKVRRLSRCAEELLSIDPTVTFYEMGV
jgi:hypothetical protein